MIKKNTRNLIFLLIEVVSFVTFIFLFINNLQIGSLILSLLPLVNFICVLFFDLLTRNKQLYIGSIIIILTYFIRNVITIIFMNISDYFVKELNINYDVALLMMGIEFALVMLVLTLTVRKRNDSTNNVNEILVDSKQEFLSKSSRIVLLFLVMISVVLTIRYPQILNVFKFGLLSDQELTNHYIAYNNSLNSMPRVTFYILSWLLILLKYVLCLVLIVKIKQSKIIKFKLILSSLVIVLCMIISTDTTADSLVFAIIYFCLLLDFYKNDYKKIILFLTIFSFAFVVFGLFSDTSSLYIARKLNAYFSGLKNITMTFNINRYNYNMFELMKGDFLRSIPLLKAFFVDMNTSSMIFNDSYNMMGQIIPNIGQSYLYFGFMLSPLLSIIFTFLTAKTEGKIYQTDNIMDKFLLLLLVIRFACVPVLYNYSIFLIGYFGTFLPLYLYNSLFKNKKVSVK